LGTSLGIRVIDAQSGDAIGYRRGVIRRLAYYAAGSPFI
jgi:hypothetical protein